MYKRLKSALKQLDNEFVKQNLDPITIKIVDGYALIDQDIRKGGYTQDIDSLTQDFSPIIKKIFAKIGVKNGLKLGWLNADMVLDDTDTIDLIIHGSNFNKVMGYKKLNVFMADLETLFKLKLIATADNIDVDKNEYDRHMLDLKNLAKKLNIVNNQLLLKKFPWIADEYPEILKILF
jgi:hypothetical protein